MRGALSATLIVAALSGCGSADEVTRTAVERGERLVSDPSITGSRFNQFACTTCHITTGTTTAILPGAPLAGAARRPTFWNGRFLTLGDAVEECTQKFMRGGALDRTSQTWIDVYAYLDSIADRGPTTPQPFDVVQTINDLPSADAAAGAAIYDRACRTCHGAPRTGEGRLEVAVVVPNETISEHGVDGPETVRKVVIEKVRHGSYLGFAGVMPPFSRETLSDNDVAALLTYLGLY
jgi:thiosulfate dehydrogenase